MKLAKQLVLLVMMAVSYTAAEYACNDTLKINITMMCDIEDGDYELMQDDSTSNCTVIITNNDVCTSIVMDCIKWLDQVDIECNKSASPSMASPPLILPRFAMLLIIAGSSGGGLCVLLLCCIIWVICCGCYIKRRKSRTWEVPDDVTELKDNDYIHAETNVQALPVCDIPCPPPLPGSNAPPPPPPPLPNSSAHPHPASHNVLSPPPPDNTPSKASGNEHPILPKKHISPPHNNVPPPPPLPGIHLPPSLPGSTRPLPSPPSRTRPLTPHVPGIQPSPLTEKFSQSSRPTHNTSPPIKTELILGPTSEAVPPPSSSPPPPNTVFEDIYDVGINISDDDEDTKPNDYINCSNFQKSSSPDYVNYNPSKPMMIAEPYADVGNRSRRPSRPINIKAETDEYVEMSLSVTPQTNLYI